MSWQKNLSCLLVMAAIWLPNRPVVADPPKGADTVAPAEDIDFEALVREAQTVIDAVLEHHLDPPTRQELWLAGAKALLAKVGVTHRPGLSAEISKLTTTDQFAAFAKGLCMEDAIAQSGHSGPALRKAFVDGLLAAVPGGA